MIKPAIIRNIESVIGLTLHPATETGHDPIQNVMACHKDPDRPTLWQPQYVLHSDNAVAGLNFYDLGLTDEKWLQVVQLLPNERIEALNLRGNALTSMAGLEKMPNLRFLDLSDNYLKEFALPEAADRLEHLWLGGNDDLVSPPPEIVKQGRFALRNYFRELAEQGSEVVFEAKLLILGDAGAGKTTLARKIENPDALPPDEVKDSTTGIKVSRLHLKDQSPTFTMHVWDFGGQEVYHATHRFFLTKKSLYLLLCDGRKEEQFDYWLQMQEIYGKDSLLLLVVNQKGDMQPNLPMSDLRRDYPNVQDANPKVVNLLTNRSGVLDLRTHIEWHIRSLPQFKRGEKVPKKWASIRRKLESVDSDHIPLEDFRVICKQEGITDKQKQDYLLEFLHDLGAFLHFNDIAGLNKRVILRPEWATQAVYNVLDHTREKKDNGHFTRQDLNQVWGCEAYEDYFEELLLLMEKFELCYRAPEKEGLYIVPSLLPDESPEGYVWEAPTLLQLHYQYTFMPKDIIARLIVRQHHLLESPPIMWKRGAVFYDQGARVEVVESYREKKITLQSDSNGRNSKELLSTIARDIDAINRSFHFNERMKVEQKVPCNCDTCKGLAVPHFFLRSNLDKAEKAGAQVQCQESFTLVSVRELLDGIFATEGSGKLFTNEILVEMVEMGNFEEALQAVKEDFTEASALLGELQTNKQAYNSRLIEFSELEKIQTRIRYGLLEHLKSGVKARRNT
ncbi:MAG: hypothetical protein J0M29_14485 [Chitinophagales bacterium]|nr:hypothetical protein [Chitinophagales bacterium]